MALPLFRAFRASILVTFSAGALASVIACSGSSSSPAAPADAAALSDAPGVHSTDDARRAYLGLDKSVDKAITLGFDGFNAASSANIPTQETTGDATGTMQIGGQVDQGASSNKTMRLTDTLTAYSDDGVTAYDTGSNAPAALSMMLSKIPNGTLSGTLSGSFTMSAAPLTDAGASADAGASDAGAAEPPLVGVVTLALTFTGDLQPDPNDATKVQRKPGTTHITGTASAGGYTFNVDVTR
jgi:hypothetical protein